MRWVAFACAAAGAVGLSYALRTTKHEEVVAAYATSLAGRTASQRHNALLAAQQLNGAVVEPGATFSYNRRVGTFSADAGFQKAPVSYNGSLIRDWGGGVCQTSTTLYNAALLAGFPIVERFHHRFAPGYVSPGRDAAVAFPGIDLRFKNNLAEKVRILARESHGKLLVEIRSLARPPGRIEISTDVHAIRTATTVRIPLSARSRGVRSSGHDGFEVTVYRKTQNGHEEISRDSYPAMDRVIGVPENP